MEKSESRHDANFFVIGGTAGCLAINEDKVGMRKTYGFKWRKLACMKGFRLDTTMWRIMDHGIIIYASNHQIDGA